MVSPHEKLASGGVTNGDESHWLSKHSSSSLNGFSLTVALENHRADSSFERTTMSFSPIIAGWADFIR